jgi:hypothetical protein
VISMHPGPPSWGPGCNDPSGRIVRWIKAAAASTL